MAEKSAPPPPPKKGGAPPPPPKKQAPPPPGPPAKGKHLHRQERAGTKHPSKAQATRAGRKRNHHQKGGKTPCKARTTSKGLTKSPKRHLKEAEGQTQIRPSRKRKSAADFELNWAFANQKFQMKATDTKTKSVGRQQAQS